jgi:hypothetical protein
VGIAIRRNGEFVTAKRMSFGNEAELEQVLLQQIGLLRAANDKRVAR